MKKIGLLGGMSWESTLEYYRMINRGVQARLGGLHSARVLINSVDFAEVAAMQQRGDWDAAAALLSQSAIDLQRAGAECLLICTNTMHILADRIQETLNIPLLHIADATAERIRSQGFTKIGLLGTRFTMEKEFYRGRMEERHGLTMCVPDDAGRDLVHRVIYDELCKGVLREESRAAFLGEIQKLQSLGAEAVILGCTEIGMLVSEEQSPLPAFDTTKIHAEAAVKWCLGES